MKHRLLKLGVFLLLGTIVNVAVAWIAKSRTLGTEWQNQGRRLLERAERDALFNCAPPGFDQPPHVILAQCSFFGMHRDTFIGSWDFSIDIVASFLRCGWPIESMCCEDWCITGPNGSVNQMRLGSRFFPTGILWPGFAINTIFYAAVVWLLFFAPFQFRRYRRIKRGLCPACAYPVGSSAVCTECGKPVKA